MKTERGQSSCFHSFVDRGTAHSRVEGRAARRKTRPGVLAYGIEPSTHSALVTSGAVNPGAPIDNADKLSQAWGDVDEAEETRFHFVNCFRLLFTNCQPKKWYQLKKL